MAASDWHFQPLQSPSKIERGDGLVTESEQNAVVYDMADYACLLVDDSPLMRQLVLHALARLGNVAVTQADGSLLGLKHLASNRYDLIITDINMPVMDGLKLIQRARADERHKDVPIIVISTETSIEDRERAMALGASAYITKPIQAPQVIAKVKELLKM